MAFIPRRINYAPFGPVSAAFPNSPNVNPQAPGASGQATPPSLPTEQFGHGLDASVARALNQLQANVQQALSQIASDPKAKRNILEQVPLTSGSGGGVNPNMIAHGLSAPYRGYNILTVRGGIITGHAVLPPTSAAPAEQFLLLWTVLAPFVGGTPVTADIEVWAS